MSLKDKESYERCLQDFGETGEVSPFKPTDETPQSSLYFKNTPEDMSETEMYLIFA